MDLYLRLKELGRELPPPLPAGGLYKPVVQLGNTVYISGQGSFAADGTPITGKLGGEQTLEGGQNAACTCVLNALAALHAYLGDLNRIKRVVKILGFVASAPGFHMQPQVIDGASRLLADIFGSENGVGTRSAISAIELPCDLSVEIEFLFELKD